MLKEVVAEVNFRTGRRLQHIPTLQRAAKQNRYNCRPALELARMGVPGPICASLFVCLMGLREYASQQPLSEEAHGLLELTTKEVSSCRGQFFQDVAALYFSGQKQGGFFVEVGTGEGEALSNTFMLERHYAWRGILFEPDRRFHASIGRLRSATLDTRPVFSSDGQRLEFLEVTKAGELSTLANYRGVDGHRRSGAARTLETVTLTTALKEYDAPRDIDYISVDTEGSELEVLKGLDLDSYNVKFMTIEHNFVSQKKESICEYLRPYGYREVLPEFSYHDVWLLKD